MNFGQGLSVSVFERGLEAEVIDLIVNIQANEFHIPITASDQPDLSDIPGVYQAGCGNFWVARHGGQVVGTIALIDIGGGTAALRKMFVHRNHRGNGTAKMLLEVLLDWACEHRLREIYLGTTEKFLAAHRFYEKSGFDEIPKEDLPDCFPVMKVDTKFYRYQL